MHSSNTTPPIITQEARSGYNAFGIDNSYPQATEFYLKNDSRAVMCMQWLSTFLVGKKDGTGWNTVVNSDGETVGDIYDIYMDSIATHRGAAFHVNFNAYGEPANIKLLPFEWVRLGGMTKSAASNREIDAAYVWNNWDFQNRSTTRKSNWAIYPLFNIAKAKKDIEILGESWNEYKGQVLYISLDGRNTYPISTIHGALSQLDARAHLNRALQTFAKNGMFGVVYASPKEKAGKESRDEVVNIVEHHLGADGAGGVLVMPEGWTFDKVEHQHPDILDNTQALLKRDIQECFGVPIEFTGEEKGSKLGTSDEINNAVKLYNIKTAKSRDFAWAKFAALLTLSAWGLIVPKPVPFTID